MKGIEETTAHAHLLFMNATPLKLKPFYFFIFSVKHNRSKK